MWGENWGEMVWGGGIAASLEPIPLSAWSLVVLGMVLGLIGAKLARNRNTRLFSIGLVAVLPAIAIAVTLPNTF